MASAGPPLGCEVLQVDHRSSYVPFNVLRRTVAERSPLHQQAGGLYSDQSSSHSKREKAAAGSSGAMFVKDFSCADYSLTISPKSGFMFS